MLKTKPLLVMTGTSRGIGKALKESLEKRYDIFSIGRTPSSSLVWDLSQDLTFSRQAQLTEHFLQRPPVGIIHCAGLLGPWGGPEAALENKAYWQEYKNTYQVNVTAFLQLFSCAFPAFDRKINQTPFVCHLSSGAALNAYVGWDTYCTTKAAILMAFRTLAKRYTADELLCLSVAPGTVLTDMMKNILKGDPHKFPSLEKFKTLEQTGGLVAPEAAAAAVDSWLQNSHDILKKYHGELYDVRRNTTL